MFSFMGLLVRINLYNCPFNTKLHSESEQQTHDHNLNTEHFRAVQIPSQFCYKNKQQKGPKTSDELKIEKELKQEIKELVSINTEVKNVTKVVDNNRKNLLADIQNLKSKVTSKETKTIIADISSDVKNICKVHKKWSASLNSCVCENDDEIENEDGECLNKKIVEKSRWYQEKGDSQTVMEMISNGKWFEDD